MSQWYLVRLNFKNHPLHLGELGIGMESCRERAYSDTLFSAWVSAYARLFDIQALLERFPRWPEPLDAGTLIPPFRVSSTFVYQARFSKRTTSTAKANQPQELTYRYYVPKLLLEPIGYPEDHLSIAKSYKKLAYLPLQDWQRWYQGSGFDTTTDRQKLKDWAEEYALAYAERQVPKLATDRSTQATNLYHTGLIYFDRSTSADNPSHAGLYFLLELPEADETLLNQLKAALSLLGEDGIGGDRSSGAGRFEATWSDLPAEWQAVVNFQGDNNAHALLSLLWHQPLDSVLDSIHYGHLERGGWIASPTGLQLRRKKVHMFTEGSITPHPLSGYLVDVTPERFKHRPGAHPIYRSGLGLSLPIRLKGDWMALNQEATA